MLRESVPVQHDSVEGCDLAQLTMGRGLVRVRPGSVRVGPGTVRVRHGSAGCGVAQ